MLRSLRATPAALHILSTPSSSWRAFLAVADCQLPLYSTPRKYSTSVLAMGKRKADEAEGSAAASKKKNAPSDEGLVNPKRVRILKDGDVGSGPVIYWYGSGDVHEGRGCRSWRQLTVLHAGCLGTSGPLTIGRCSMQLRWRPRARPLWPWPLTWCGLLACNLVQR